MTECSSVRVDAIARPSTASRVWRLFWMVGATVTTVFLVAWLFRSPARPPVGAAHSNTHKEREVVGPEIAGPGLLRIPPDSPVLKRLELVTLRPEASKQPTAVVSGGVVARIRKGSEPLEDRWQFGSAVVTNLYSDYQRGRNDVVFATQQLQKTKQLVEAETNFLRSTVERLSGLAQSATIPQKEFMAANAALLKAQLQGEKDVYSAEADLRAARKNLAALERSLAQNGVEPELLSHAEENMAIIAADVPEIRISLIKVGLQCEIRFYGLPDRVYRGHVEKLGSTVSPERRTLRMFFHVDDPKEEMRPGMFGEVAVGTDEHQAIRVLESSVLHVDLQDFILVAAGLDTWRAVPVRIGEGRDGRCDVIEGVASGDRVIERGSILLKGLVARSFQESANTAGGVQP